QVDEHHPHPTRYAHHVEGHESRLPEPRGHRNEPGVGDDPDPGDVTDDGRDARGRRHDRGNARGDATNRPLGVWRGPHSVGVIIAPLTPGEKTSSLRGERMVRSDAIWIVNADHWPRAY